MKMILRHDFCAYFGCSYSRTFLWTNSTMSSSTVAGRRHSFSGSINNSIFAKSIVRPGLSELKSFSLGIKNSKSKR